LKRQFEEAEWLRNAYHRASKILAALKTQLGASGLRSLDRDIQAIRASTTDRQEATEIALYSLYAAIHRALLEQRLVDTQPTFDSIKVPPERWAKWPDVPIPTIPEPARQRWEAQILQIQDTEQELAEFRDPESELEAKRQYMGTTAPHLRHWDEFHHGRIRQYAEIPARLREDEELLRVMWQRVWDAGGQLLPVPAGILGAIWKTAESGEVAGAHHPWDDVSINISNDPERGGTF
jgi:hypothetical protein